MTAITGAAQNTLYILASTGFVGNYGIWQEIATHRKSHDIT